MVFSVLELFQWNSIWQANCIRRIFNRIEDWFHLSHLLALLDICMNPKNLLMLFASHLKQHQWHVSLCLELCVTISLFKLNWLCFVLVVQTDGSYKCQLCPDFQCTGPIPMQAHLSGKQHKKKLLNNLPVKNVSTLEVGNVFSSSTKLSLNPSFSSGPKMSVEERVEQAWKHVAICGYEYDDSFATLSVDNKITALSSHFAFISKNDPIPSLVQYLSIWWFVSSSGYFTLGYCLQLFSCIVCVWKGYKIFKY